MDMYASGLKRSMPFANLIAMGNDDSDNDDDAFTSNAASSSHDWFLDGKYSYEQSSKRQRLALLDSDDSDTESVDNRKSATEALEAALLDGEDLPDEDFLSPFTTACDIDLSSRSPVMKKHHRMHQPIHHHHHHLCTKSSQRTHRGHRHQAPSYAVNEMGLLMSRMTTTVSTV